MGEKKKQKKKGGDRNIKKITEFTFLTTDAALPPTSSWLQL